MANEQEPLVFGDPDEPMTVGVFVTWLERCFNPHAEAERVQQLRVDQIQKAILGNGNPKQGLCYKVDKLVEVSSAISNVTRVVWATVLGLLAVGSSVAAIGRSIGFW